LIFATARFDHSDEYHQSRVAHTDAMAEVWNMVGFIDHWRRRLRWNPAVRVLDVGCAEGRMLELMRMAGFKVSGIDVSDFYQSHWRVRGLDARVAEVSQVSGSFDAVVARQVIEHVTVPSAFIEECGRLLAPGGSLLIETGDPDSIQARVLGARWAFWIPAEGAGAHTSFIGRRTAALFGEWAGLRLEGSVPKFRYTPFTSYRHRKSLPLAVVGYGLHRTALSAGRCYWFTKQP
jgi:2-polyprenyl-3-methyl-5-hydroxy-6-metoxy-1,4-benzoquinol methylase